MSFLSRKKKKVLLVGIDGVPYDSLKKVATPALERLHIIPAMTGGYAGEESEGALSSAPGWLTILTGVWANKHQVRNQSTPISNRQFPSIFQHIKMALPESYIASIAQWPNIIEQYLQREQQHIDYIVNSIPDDEVTEEVVHLIKRGQPDFIFVQLDETDAIGHLHGFSEEFDRAVQKADARMQAMLNAIEYRRMKYPEEDWLVLAVSDHGRDSRDGFMHGMTEPQDSMEKCVFIASNQPIAQGLYPLPVDLDERPDHQKAHSLIPVTAIVPTVLQHMDIHIFEDMLFDGTSLFTRDAAARFKATHDIEKEIVQLEWYVRDRLNSKIDVYCNHQLIATLEASARNWELPCPNLKQGNNIFDFSLVIDGTPLSTRLSVDHYQTASFDPMLTRGIKHFYSFEKGITDLVGSNDMANQCPEPETIHSNSSLSALAIDRSKGYFSIADTFSDKSFTIGFWLFCTPSSEDVLILGTKDWSRGINKGWAFKTRSGAIRFNMADGVHETYNKGIRFTQNQWVYVAASIDREQKSIDVYVGDRYHRMQSDTLPMEKLAETFIPGAMIGLNEDGTGAANLAANKKTVMKFAEIAIWERSLTQPEIETIFRNKGSLKNLMQ